MNHKKQHKWGNPTRPKKHTPAELWHQACQYFEWCDQNPWIKMQPAKTTPKHPAPPQEPTLFDLDELTPQPPPPPATIPVPVQRPYTIEGLCTYLDINRTAFDNYSYKEEHEAYFDTCARIRQIIDTQNFEGGMVGAFNAGIVTRKLGLADRRELTGRDGKDLCTTIILQLDTTAKQTFAHDEQQADNPA